MAATSVTHWYKNTQFHKNHPSLLLGYHSQRSRVRLLANKAKTEQKHMAQKIKQANSPVRGRCSFDWQLNERYKRLCFGACVLHFFLLNEPIASGTSYSPNLTGEIKESRPNPNSTRISLFLRDQLSNFHRHFWQACSSGSTFFNDRAERKNRNKPFLQV